MKVAFEVNGKALEVDVEPRLSLADCLRDVMGLTGTHLGCEHGVCGSCTVQIDGKAVRSCLTFAVQVEGRAVDTVESLADEHGEMSDLQIAFRKHHGLQCGFCTPGMVMSSIDLLQKNKNPSEKEIRDWLEGNICRCTGYQGIVKAVKDAATKL